MDEHAVCVTANAKRKKETFLSVSNIVGKYRKVSPKLTMSDSVKAVGADVDDSSKEENDSLYRSFYGYSCSAWKEK